MKQSLAQAKHLVASRKSRAFGRAASYLDGLPVGGWGETEQAMRQIVEELPHRSERAYTVTEFVSAVYTVDTACRYRRAL